MAFPPSSRPRTSVQAAIRLKQLAIDGRDQLINRLRADLGKRRREVEKLEEEKEMREIYRDRTLHELELIRGDNFDLRNSIEISHYRKKKLVEYITRAREEKADDRKRLNEIWDTITHLSEVNVSLTKKIERAKAKKHQAMTEHQELMVGKAQIIDDAHAENLTLNDQVAQLTAENIQLMQLMENMVQEEEPEEDLA